MNKVWFKERFLIPRGPGRASEGGVRCLGRNGSGSGGLGSALSQAPQPEVGQLSEVTPAAFWKFRGGFTSCLAGPPGSEGHYGHT